MSFLLFVTKERIVCRRDRRKHANKEPAERHKRALRDRLPLHDLNALDKPRLRADAIQDGPDISDISGNGDKKIMILGHLSYFSGFDAGPDGLRDSGSLFGCTAC
jgi:hypothetical protein